MANFNLPTAIFTHYNHVGFVSWPLRKDIVRGCVSVCAGLLIWEMLARLFLENELLIPPPSSVLESFWRLAVSGQLNKHFAATLSEFTYGFATATIVGIIVGYLMGMHRWFDEIMDPWIATLYSIPIITVVPLIIIWFGIGIVSKVIVVFKITAVAIILNTAAGIKNLDPIWLELAKSLRLSRWETTYKIRFPGALPYRNAPWRGPSFAGSDRRRADGRKCRTRLFTARRLGNMGQPQVICHRHIAGDYRAGQL